ncbi:MAG: M15 family metallopeptidase [archaeon]
MKAKLCDLKECGFIIDNRERRYYSKSKKIFLNKSATDALLKAKEYLPKSHNFKITDGKRSLTEQRKIVKMCEKQFKKEYPKNWEKLLDIYTGGYVELKFKKIPFMNHLSGNTVDLTIIKNKKELDMGDVKFNEKDKLSFFERKKNLTKKEKVIRDNRRVLKKVMTKAGFKSYPLEWWHWGFKK